MAGTGRPRGRPPTHRCSMYSMDTGKERPGTTMMGAPALSTTHPSGQRRGLIAARGVTTPSPPLTLVPTARSHVQHQNSPSI
jgi:hypothetical protein